MKVQRVVLIVFFLFVFSGALLAQRSLPSEDVGVEEKLGNFVPLDIPFLNEMGDTVYLRDLITRPTLLSLIYYRCPGICSPLISGIVDVLDKVDLKPGVEYQVLTVSFDERDTPQLSRQKKKNYLLAFSRPFPAEAWHWLVGDSASIHALTNAVGFQFKRQGDDFIHPGLMTVLSPEGKVVRYLYGITFLPFDVKMAVYEASQGRVGPTISKVLLYCFSYDPEGKKYVFNFLKVSGTVVLFFAFTFLGVLVIGGRMRKKRTK